MDYCIKTYFSSAQPISQHTGQCISHSVNLRWSRRIFATQLTLRTPQLDDRRMMPCCLLRRVPVTWPFGQTVELEYRGEQTTQCNQIISIALCKLMVSLRCFIICFSLIRKEYKWNRNVSSQMLNTEMSLQTIYTSFCFAMSPGSLFELLWVSGKWFQENDYFIAPTPKHTRFTPRCTCI